MSQDYTEAVKWYREAAVQGNVMAQHSLGAAYAGGKGVPKDYVEAVKWWQKAAEQGFALAQAQLALNYVTGEGVGKDYVEAYKWANLASAQGEEVGSKLLSSLETLSTRQQVAEAQRLTREFKPRVAPAPSSDASRFSMISLRPDSSATGFFITAD